jgi:hypothetical protein
MKGGAAIEIFKNNILHNPIVLYFIFAISLLYLFYFSAVNDYSLVAIFILTGVVTSFFSKNMVVILCISLVVSFLLKHAGKHALEGFQEGNEDEKEKDKEGMLSPLEASNVGNGSSVTSKYAGSKTNEIDADISKMKSEQTQLKNTMDALDSKKVNLPPEQLEMLKDSYKELHSVGTKLLGTQEKIITNFEKIEPLIKDAEKLVDQMNGAVDNMKTIVQNKK